MDPKIKKRIERLQAMANDSSSEHEAMIATRRLHSLLAKHGLEDVDFTSSMGEDSFDVTKEMGGGRWSKVIAMAVCRLYFCEVCTSSIGGSTGHTVFVSGSDKYRSTAILMSKAVISAVDQEARASVHTTTPKPSNAWSYICSFRTAAAYRVYHRCEEMIRLAKAGELEDSENPGTTLPVMASQYENELSAAHDFMSSKHKLTTSRTKATVRCSQGVSDGHSFGDRVSLGGDRLSQNAPKRIG